MIQVNNTIIIERINASEIIQPNGVIYHPKEFRISIGRNTKPTQCSFFTVNLCVFYLENNIMFIKTVDIDLV